MTTYNTGNPVPSADTRDRYDNSQAFDEAIAGQAPSFLDRLGVERKSWAGMELDFTQAQQSRESSYEAWLAAAGFESTHLTYVDGQELIVDRPTQLIDYDGSVYRVKMPADFPVTLPDTWATAAPLLVDVGDASIRQLFASPDGASLIGGGGQVVSDIAALRLLINSKPSKSAFVMGYYSPGDGGGGAYYLDAGDTTTDDNGGSVIVAEDGGRWKLSSTGPVMVDQFGARGDSSTNDTPAIQAAIDYAYATGRRPVHFGAKNYALGASVDKPTCCIFNPGVSLIGAGALRTQLVPVAGLPNTVDYMLVQPLEGIALDWIELRNFIVYPGANGTKLGNRAVVIDMDSTSNASSLLFEGLYLAPGNGRSIEWVTNSTNNLQGGPANTVFMRNHFWEGVQLVNHGDSIYFKNNVFRSSIGSFRTGLLVEGVSAAGGQPAQLTVQGNNFDCDGGAIWLKNGLSTKLIGNNIEQSHGTGTGSGACIDVDGNANRVGWCEISGNNFGVFGTAALGQVIRVNNAGGTKIRDNRLLSASAAVSARAILITASASDTEVFGNELSVNFPETILDQGVGTRGVGRFVTPLNGFANTGNGSQPLTVYKAPDGRIHLAGVLNCPASPSGKLVASLPAGFRHVYLQAIGVTVLAGGLYEPARLEIATNGDVIFYATAASPTQLFIDVSFGGLGFITGDL